jgi:hypothetical protein
MQVLFWFFLKIRLNMVWFMVSDGYTVRRNNHDTDKKDTIDSKKK